MRFCEVDKVLEDTLDDEIHETDNYHQGIVHCCLGCVVGFSQCTENMGR